MSTYEELLEKFGLDDFFSFHGDLYTLERRDGVPYRPIDSGRRDGCITTLCQGTSKDKTRYTNLFPDDEIDPQLLKEVESALHRVNPGVAANIMFALWAKSYGANGFVEYQRDVEYQRETDKIVGFVSISDSGIPVARIDETRIRRTIRAFKDIWFG